MSYTAKCAPFKYQIGEQYMSRGKHPRLCTIVDRMTLTDDNGGVRKRFYVSKHEFMGQWVFDYEVSNATVAMGKASLLEHA